MLSSVARSPLLASVARSPAHGRKGQGCRSRPEPAAPVRAPTVSRASSAGKGADRIQSQQHQLYLASADSTAASANIASAPIIVLFPAPSTASSGL
ncbi:hypothetical protein Cni_G07448 [Canna indica]|uniref:Uncharacterized protein n=1 Tax=Canna indica TaxID=4628 RepID=A0AAQ3JZ47_9LILI|nr:hypothetical protein Cni_G07448 [Canna indica]